jgi:hypothetical protein
MSVVIAERVSEESVGGGGGAVVAGADVATDAVELG